MLLVTECRVGALKFGNECRVEIRAGIITICGAMRDFGNAVRLLETSRRSLMVQLFRLWVADGVSFLSIFWHAFENGSSFAGVVHCPYGQGLGRDRWGKGRAC